jgi:hypothetical protein
MINLLQQFNFFLKGHQLQRVKGAIQRLPLRRGQGDLAMPAADSDDLWAPLKVSFLIKDINKILESVQAQWDALPAL